MSPCENMRINIIIIACITTSVQILLNIPLYRFHCYSSLIFNIFGNQTVVSTCVLTELVRKNTEEEKKIRWQVQGEQKKLQLVFFLLSIFSLCDSVSSWMTPQYFFGIFLASIGKWEVFSLNLLSSMVVLRCKSNKMFNKIANSRGA